MRKRIIALLSIALLCQTTPLFSQDFSEGINARTVRKANRAKKVPVLADICKSVSPVRALLKNAYPGHIQLSDSRASGFALVCSRSDCPKKFPASGYYSDGSLAFKLGYYGRWSGNGQPRAYCGTGGAPRCSASGIKRAAKARGRDGRVYIDFGGGSCRSAVPGTRNGSPF